MAKGTWDRLDFALCGQAVIDLLAQHVEEKKAEIEGPAAESYCRVRKYIPILWSQLHKKAIVS